MSNLIGKTVIFLGSSVTYGHDVPGISFVEFLKEQEKIIPVKEAVSGTTLADIDESSYISRMKKIDKNINADAFVCQLSTNDARHLINLGKISSDNNFDTQTVAGAIEYIINYAKSTWGCPVIFYTGTKYDNDHYAKMINLLSEIKSKHKIFVIDLWNNDKMNTVSEKDYKKYMKDSIHPTVLGYEKWWTPVIKKELIKILSEVKNDKIYG